MGRVLNVLVAVPIRNPRLTLACWLVALAVSGMGLVQLTIEPSPASFLGREDDAWAFYEQSVSRFGADQAITVALHSDEPWHPRALRETVRITRAVEVLPGVRRVDSLASVPIVAAGSDGSLQIEPALGDLDPARPDPLAEIQRLVAQDRIVARNLVSEDGRVLAINIVLDFDATDAQRVWILDSIGSQLGSQPAWVSGVPVFEVRCGPRLLKELTTFVPVTLLLLSVCLVALFRSPVAAIAPLLASGVASGIVLGVMGAVGTPITLVSMVLPSLWLAFGCSYAMHVLTAARGAADAPTLIGAVQSVAGPIALSGLTTAAGFFALGSIPLDAIGGMGRFGGLGVLGVLAATLTLVPAMLRLFPLATPGAGSESWIRPWMAGGLVRGVARHRTGLLVGWAVLVAMASVGLTRLEVETDATRWWPPGSAEREDFDAIRNQLSGISPMNVVIQAVGDASVTEPAVLARIDALAAYLDARPEVGRAVSLADPLRQLNGSLLGDATQPLPQVAARIEQYMLLLGFVERMNLLVSPDRSSANIPLRVDDNGSRSLLQLADDAEAWWREHGAPGFEARTTGIMFEFARSEEAIAWGQIQGLALSLLAVAIILLLVFRSPALVGLALIPNLIPLGVVYGAMGLLGIPLDGSTACVGAVTLGIAVDDTIHVLSGYRDARRAGAGRHEALRRSFDRVLAPLVYTTVVVGVGFGVLMLSGFQPTYSLGIVTILVLLLCLLADTTLLPALLLATGVRDDHETAGRPERRHESVGWPTDLKPDVLRSSPSRRYEGS